MKVHLNHYPDRQIFYLTCFLCRHCTLISTQDLLESLKNVRVFKRQLKTFHPIKSTGLLTEPPYTQTTIRIELLIHLIIAYGSEYKKSNFAGSNMAQSETWVYDVFKMEDPVGGCFSFLMLWRNMEMHEFSRELEEKDFYLQRIYNIIQTLPDKLNTRILISEVHALSD